MSESEHHHPNYVKIWAILVVLLVVSVLGPELGIRSVTLFTAFGIAIIKAYMVAKNFMHVSVEPRFVTYLLMTGVLFVVLFFAGTAPDVMNAEGTNWEKSSWLAAEASAPAEAENHH
jgi:caa(3)-type oxidase subunit IV